MSGVRLLRGEVRRVNGPVVEAVGLDGVAVFDVVEVGAERLAGEVTAIDSGIVTAQVYEYDGGIAPGDPVMSRGEPLAIGLGPGLLGGVFDGVLRPLSAAGTWLVPGARGRSPSGRVTMASPSRTATGSPPSAPAGSPGCWHFVPSQTAGVAVAGGTVLGRVAEGQRFEHRILVPPDRGGHLECLAAEGDYERDDPIARIDGRELTLEQRWPVRRPRPVRSRDRATRALRTGQRVLDLLYPIALGSTASVPGGFGTGKTLLLQQIAKWCDADLIVYVGCGERGNEMIDVLEDLAHLTDPRHGGYLRERTVTIANTSNMPVMAREASIYTAVAVAEYFRDMGLDVVVIADSTSRWAEALREFASRTDQLPAEEGYPATLPSALAAFYERAGSFTTLSGDRGSVTLIGAVSPPGGDLTEPVTAHTRRLVRCVWSLDRDLAYARHYPAVSWNDSFSRDAEMVAGLRARDGDSSWAEERALTISLLGEAERLESLVELVGAAALPDRQRVVRRSARLLREAVLQQDASSTQDAYCGEAKQRELLETVLDIHHRLIGLVQGGLAVSTLEQLDLSRVAAARESGGPDDVAAVRQIHAATVTQLEALG